MIVFDEVEKAHPDIYNILLQICDDGGLSDTKGNFVSFKACSIFLTTNIGAQVYNKPVMGFQQTVPDVTHDINKEIENSFRPEILNRIDEIIHFKSLTTTDIEQICNIQLTKLQARLQKEHDIAIVFTQEVVKLCAAQGFSEKYMAREIHRCIVRLIENPLATFIFGNKHIKSISIQVTQNKINITEKKSE